MLGKQFKELYNTKDFLPEQEFLIFDGNNTYTLKITYDYKLELYSKEDGIDVKVALPDLSFIRDDLKMYIDDEAEEQAFSNLKSIAEDVLEEVAKEKYGEDCVVIKADDQIKQDLNELYSISNEELREELLEYYHTVYLYDKYGPGEDEDEYYEEDDEC